MRSCRLAAILACAALVGCENPGASAPSAPSGAAPAAQPPAANTLKPEKGKRGEKPLPPVSGTLD